MARPKANPPAEWLYAHKWRIFGVMMIGWSMSLLDVSIVNITIPTLQKELGAGVSTVSWVVNAYNVTFAVFLVSMGRLADQFGRKRFFLIGLALFTVGSALCASAWDIWALIGFRAIQGMGAGILAPLGFAMTALVFPPQQRGRGLALIAVVALVSTAIGPTLGGVIVQLLSWHWVFLVNIPFGILGLVLCRRWWPETYDLTAGRKVDWLGMGLLAGTVFCLIFSLVQANSLGWTNPLILFLLQLTVLFAVGFVLSQRYGASPMLTRELTGNRQFVNANLAMLLFGAGAIGSQFLLALTFVDLWGYTPLEAAFALTPVPICGLLAWPIVGRAADRTAPGDLAKRSLVIMAIGLLWVSFMPIVSNYLAILPGLLMIGIGMGTVFPALNVGAMGAVQGQQLGLASGIVNTSRQLGAAIGLAMLVAVFATTAGLGLYFSSDDISDLAKDQGQPPPTTKYVVKRTFGDYSGLYSTRFVVRPGFDQAIVRHTLSAARDAYGWAFRVAALMVLGAVPLARTMRSRPGQPQAAPGTRRAVATGPPAGAPAPTGARAEPA